MTDKQITDREVKALQIAAKQKLTRKGNVWFVPSQAGQGEYEVRPDPQAPRCTCPDYEYRNARCKHIVAVEYVMMRETTPDGRIVVTETVKVTRKTYTQDWKTYNHAQRHEKSDYRLCSTSFAKTYMSHDDRPMTRHMVLALVKRYALAARLPPYVTAPQLCHAFVVGGRLNPACPGAVGAWRYLQHGALHTPDAGGFAGAVQ